MRILGIKQRICEFLNTDVGRSENICGGEREGHEGVRICKDSGSVLKVIQ